MLLGPILALWTLLFTAILAASDDSTPPFEVTNLRISKHAFANASNVIIEFEVRDRAPLGNGSAVCTSSWIARSKGYPHDSYKACGNTTFAWHMESYENMKSFQLGIEHVYEDPDVGDPPYDMITNFGKADVKQPAIKCKAASSVHVCKQRDDETIKVPIYASIAKRRR